jgi:serine/threonine protein kinase
MLINMFQNNQMELLEQDVGTFAYMAPEIILHSKGSYSADVYSFGVILWYVSFDCLDFLASAA